MLSSSFMVYFRNTIILPSAVTSKNVMFLVFSFEKNYIVMLTRLKNIEDGLCLFTNSY